MSQISFPTDVSPTELARETTLGGAISLCVKAGKREPKEVMDKLRVGGKPLDKGQWSRWESGGEGVIWPKLRALMDYCGNDAPLLWMLQDRGYDVSSLRKTESETEKALRLANERIAKLEQQRETELRMWRDLRTN